MQRAYYWTLSNDNVSSIRNESYKPFGLHNNKFYYFENATLKVKDLSSSPTGGSFSDFNNVSNWNGGNNSYSPYQHLLIQEVGHHMGSFGLYQTVVIQITYMQ